MSSNSDIDVFDGVELNTAHLSAQSFLEAWVVEEYDVDEYASVTILHNEDKNERLYQVNEPTLSPFENLIRTTVAQRLISALKYAKVGEDHREMEKVVNEESRKIIEKYVQPGSRISTKIIENMPRLKAKRTVTPEEIERILYYLRRDIVYYGKITPIMRDPNIEDVSCNSPNRPVFVYHSEYRDMPTNIAYTEDSLDKFIRTLAQGAGKHISVSQPMIDGSLSDGSRVQLTLGREVTGDGSNFTIRKFEDVPFTPIDLIKFNTFSIDQMAYLWLAIENNKSLIFAGGTASGKTTSMNAVSLFIPPGSKTITIEDTREIQLRHTNWIKSMTRDSFGGNDDTGEVGMYALLKAALRQRPEYLIVGEIRGKEAQTLFQAMATGHTTYSTMHADSVDSAVHRLENPPIEVPRPMLKSLDILCIQNQTYLGEKRVRRNDMVVEIEGIDNRTRRINTNELFEWNPETDEFDQTGDSSILAQVARQRGWTIEELTRQLKMRKDVLQYLYDNDITAYEDVTDIFRMFMMNSQSIIEQMQDDTLKDRALDDSIESSDIITVGGETSDSDNEEENEETTEEVQKSSFLTSLTNKLKRSTPTQSEAVDKESPQPETEEEPSTESSEIADENEDGDDDGSESKVSSFLSKISRSSDSDKELSESDGEKDRKSVDDTGTDDVFTDQADSENQSQGSAEREILDEEDGVDELVADITAGEKDEDEDEDEEDGIDALVADITAGEKDEDEDKEDGIDALVADITAGEKDEDGAGSQDELVTSKPAEKADTEDK